MSNLHMQTYLYSLRRAAVAACLAALRPHRWLTSVASIFFLACLLLVGQMAYATTAPAAQFLLPNGTLNTAAIGNQQLNLDLKGWDVHLDPTLGPVFSPAPPPTISLSALDRGLNGQVYAIAVSGSDVYVGGQFTNVGSDGTSVTGLKNIAKWNTTSLTWSALGNGLNDIVYTIAISGSNLYVGGVFTNAGGGTPISGLFKIAKWNTTTSAWSALSNGLNNDVFAIAINGNDVYVGGNFGESMNFDVSGLNNIAKWNTTTSTWSALNTGLDNAVYTLAIVNNIVYAGGAFNNVGSGNLINGLRHIAKWNGSAWSALGNGLSNVVYAIAGSGSGNELFVGGAFTDVGLGATSIPGLRHIAKWSGSAWSALGNGLNNRVFAIAMLGSDVYAGGQFTDVGGGASISGLNYIAKWNGSAWSALNQGLNATINFNGMAASSDGVYSGGRFTNVGGGTTVLGLSHIAKWGAVPPVITITGTLTAFLTCVGSASAEQSFTLSGADLTDNLTVTAPAGFEVSTTSGSGFNTSLTLTPSNGSVSITIYVRIAATATGTPSGNVVCASSGGVPRSVAASGSVNIVPTITLGSISSVNSTSTAFGIPYTATAGSPNQYSLVAGTPTAMPNFTAVNDTTLGTSPISITIPASAANTYNFNLTLRNSTTGCVSAAVPVALVVTTPGTPLITATGTLTAFSACLGTASAEKNFTVSGTDLTANITVTAPTGFEVSTSSGSGFNTSLTLTPIGTNVATTTIFVRIAATATGTPSSNISLTSAGATSRNVAVNGTVNTLPTITLGTIASVNTTATSFSIPYTATTGSPNQYSLVAGTPTAMPGFAAVNNTTLPASPSSLSITIPASAATTYNFNLTVHNSTTGCVSTAVPVAVTVEINSDDFWHTSTTAYGTKKVWMLNSTTGWAVGSKGLILYTTNGGISWASQTSGVTGDINAVWGSDANNVWAGVEGGTILKYNGTSWSAQPSGTTLNINAVWGSDANNVWAVGTVGTILKYNGTAWSAQTSGTTKAINAVWGSDANNVWAVGLDGTILKYNGTSWTAQTSNVTSTLSGVWGSDANNVWAVGDFGTILKYNGTSWATQTSNATSTLYGVWGSDANNIWAVGINGAILKYNGSTWGRQTSGTMSFLYGVWGSDANNVWAVGINGTILKYNGTSWAIQAPVTTNTLHGVWGSDANNVWAVGVGGTILKYNGTSWSAQPSGTTLNINAVWGSDANNVWAVGQVGTILKYNGTAWSAQTSGTTKFLYGVWGSDANNVWAVGENGTILKYNGTAWSAQTSGTNNTINAVWGSDANNVWAVGASGIILKYNGTSWAAQTSNTSEWLYAVWGSDANNVWAVSFKGTILKYNGTSWAAQTSGTTQFLYGVWGSDANNVWAVGSNGTILKYNGTSWAAELPDIKLTNYAISGVGTQGFIAAGIGTVFTKSLTSTPAGSLAIGTPTNPTNCVPSNGSIAFTSTGFAAGPQTLNYSKDGTATSAIVTVAANGTFSLTGLGAGAYTAFAIGATTATGTNPTLVSPTLPTITLGTITGVNTTAMSFSIPYTSTTGDPTQYSLVAGTPTMSGFMAVSNATLPASPGSLSVPIPASTANTYNFNLTVRNSTTGCVSTAQSVALAVTTPAIITTTGALNAFFGLCGYGFGRSGFYGEW